MRNTTMSEKLTKAVASVPALPQPVAVKRRAKAVEEEPPITRYAVPPRRRNPFSYHAFPVAEPQIAPEPSPKEERTSLELVPSIPSESSEPSEPCKLSEPVSQAFSETEVKLVEEQSPEVPLVVLPPDLAWLEQPTPFGADLKAMVERLRNAKTNINFTLAEGIKREAQKKQDLEQEQFNNLVLRDKLSQIENTILALAMVAEQSSELDPQMMGKAYPKQLHRPNGTPEANEKLSKRGRHPDGDPNYCTKADMMSWFKANPNTNVTAREIRETLPKSKHAHAKGYLPIALAEAYKNGLIERVGVGVYRYMPKS